MKKTFKVPVVWEVYGKVEVEAETKEEAIEIVEKDEGGLIPLPTESYYVDGSFSLSSDDIDEMVDMVE
jgi:hypothetical protein